MRFDFDLTKSSSSSLNPNPVQLNYEAIDLSSLLREAIESVKPLAEGSGKRFLFDP
jgi:hypothetical protein